jgi:retinoblastoma-like protein 1
VVERTHMLKDRHLDQIIMCSIYVFIRVKYGTFNKLTFKDIMYQYRYQPQSTSQVYRSVFIEYTNDATATTAEGGK